MTDRKLTRDTKWIICMWDIRGERVEETAMLLKRSIEQVKKIIADCRQDGYYDKVRRHIEYFDMVNARNALKGFASFLSHGQRGIEYEQ